MKKNKNIESKNKIINAIIPVLENIRKIRAQYKDDLKTQKNIDRMTRTLICVSFENVLADYISLDALKKLRQKEANELSYRSVKSTQIKGLRFEHCTPMNEIIRDIYKKKSIKSVLQNRLETAWITKKEDDKLRKNGYRDVRPNGWEKCYKKCQIRLKKVKRNKN